MAGEYYIPAGFSWNKEILLDTTTTLQTFQAWPVEDRRELVFGLWDQIVSAGWQPEPTEELNLELDRRLAAHEANPTNLRTWEQILQNVRKQP